MLFEPTFDGAFTLLIDVNVEHIPIRNISDRPIIIKDDSLLRYLVSLDPNCRAT